MISILKQTTVLMGLIWNQVVFWFFWVRDENYFTNMGLIFLELGNTKRAIKAFEMSQKAHGYSNVEFSKCNWFSLGYCYLELGDFKTASRYFENYLRFDKTNAEILSIVGWCHELMRNYNETLIYYSKALMLDPDAKAVYIEYAKILSDVGRKDEAISSLKIAETKVDTSVEKNIIHAIAEKIKGNLGESIHLLKQTISEMDRISFTSDYFNPHDIHMLLAEYQKETGDFKGALSTLEISHCRYPKDLWLTNELAMEYADQKVNLTLALELINSILKYQPYNSIFIDTKGWILLKMGEKEEAEKLFHLSLSLNPNNNDTIVHYNALMGVSQSTN